MFIKNIESVVVCDNLVYCTNKEKKYLQKNNIFPISSIVKNKKLRWIFVKNQEVDTLLNELHKNRLLKGGDNFGTIKT